jgi:ABC-type multidrug transport system fused ATPase/permease subunit
MTILSADSTEIFEAFQSIPLVITMPLMLAGILAYIFAEVGWIGLIGPVVITVNYLFYMKSQEWLIKTKAKYTLSSDVRSKALSEYLVGIKILKYYAWENVVEKYLSTVRANEKQLIFAAGFYRSLGPLSLNLIPIIISMIVFGAYAAMEGSLPMDKAFTVLSLFNLVLVS